MKNADMPAMPVIDEEQSFPVDMERYGSKEATLRFAFGMTKREMMAMHMMQGILTGQDTNEMVVGDDKCFAEFAVQCADALLAELERTK